jgi:hypothetical protein
MIVIIFYEDKKFYTEFQGRIKTDVELHNFVHAPKTCLTTL